MSIVHVPYTLGQDEDGFWFAHAWLGSSGGANGNGATPEEAVTDLREAVEMVIDEDGRSTTVPVHPGRDVPKGTLLSVLQDLDMAVEELQEYL